MDGRTAHAIVTRPQEWIQLCGQVDARKHALGIERIPDVLTEELQQRELHLRVGIIEELRDRRIRQLDAADAQTQSLPRDERRDALTRIGRARPTDQVLQHVASQLELVNQRHRVVVHHVAFVGRAIEQEGSHDLASVHR